MNGSTPHASSDTDSSLLNDANGSPLSSANATSLNGTSHTSLNGTNPSSSNGIRHSSSKGRPQIPSNQIDPSSLDGPTQSFHNGAHEAQPNGTHPALSNGSTPHDIKANCNQVNGAGSGRPHINGEAPSHSQMPIAICGMALRLPGGVQTPQQYWDFLVEGKDGRIKVPESRYNISAFYDPSGKPATVPTEYGYFLDNDLGALDTSFFSMPRTEVEHASPEQRMMLEVVRETFEDSGETGWRGRNIGCYMGSFGEDWSEMTNRETQGWGHYRLSGPADFVLSNRVSYEMDLRGPRLVKHKSCSLHR